MKYKKIYIEITNICNLNCSFCSKTKRNKEAMTKEEFKQVLQKINNYTDYIYLHIKGEPLIHKDLDEILSLTKEYHKKVCITTNGVFLKDKLGILKKYDNIYRINISLHSENKKENYLEDILSSIDNLTYPYISLRFWTLDKGIMDNKTKNYLNQIKEKYKVEEIKDGIKLKDKVYLSLDDKFDWPDINNNYLKDGYCLGGKTHLGILSDGRVVICCLDGEGYSDLGNIYTNTLEEIISSNKYQEVIKNFQERKCYLEICKHCSYKERFNK